MENKPVDLFAGTIATLSRSMDLRARSHEMILNNVANADTPNFKPFSLNVEEALRRDPPPNASAPLTRTDDHHLPGRQVPGDPSLEARPAADDPLLLRGDRNGVDIDKEMTALAKNSLLYRATTQIVASKFSGLKKAITGGNQ